MERFRRLVENLLEENSDIFVTGVEREGLRVKQDGKLALTPHPEAFGLKLENYHIKTDFCESQPEIVTSPTSSVEETYKELGEYTTILKHEIAKQGEIFWSQSMPCILPQEDQIKTAQHPGDFAKPLRDYLACVRELYGAKIQTICGIHYNLSIEDSFFVSLQKSLHNTEELKLFKNAQYLKILRNYTRYHWFVLMLTGASPAVHKSFGYALDSLNAYGDDLLVGEYATSLRMSRIGYQNKTQVQIKYDTLENFTESILHAVKCGDLIDEGALFAPIKVKAKDNVNYVQSLQKDGVLYIELRDIDLNPFDQNAFSEQDMRVLQLFAMYMLCLDDELCADWQEQAKENAYRVAEYGWNTDCVLLNGNKEVNLQDVVSKLCSELLLFNEQTHFMEEQELSVALSRTQNRELSYATKILHDIKIKGYVNANLEANIK